MLAARLATAVIGAPIILAITWLGGPIFWIAAAAAAGLAGWEAARLIQVEPRHKPWTILTALGSMLLVLSSPAGPTALIAALAIVLLIGLALGLIFSASSEAVGFGWSRALAATAYAGLPLSLLVVIRQWPGETSLTIAPLGTMTRGAGWVFLTLTAVWAVDTAAYGVGRLFGRRKLWPAVSPNKTWEGTIAGIVAGVIVCEAWSSSLQIGGESAFVIGIALAGGAVLGDLVESALKRMARVKDSGTLLPGHGGLLDRIDSLAFSAVVVFLSGVLLGSAGAWILF